MKFTWKIIRLSFILNSLSCNLKKISQFVQQSFSLKAKNEHLLNVAKRAVEMAIE